MLPSGRAARPVPLGEASSLGSPPAVGRPSGDRRPVRIHLGSPSSRSSAIRSKNATSERIKLQTNTPALGR